MSKACNPIFDKNYLLKTTRKSEILSRLEEVHVALSSLSQDVGDRPKHINAIAANLISNKFLYSTDKDMRLLSCACVVDILRVYAPEAPYSDAELCAIFRAISRELKGLGTCNMESTQGTRIFYVLQSLSIVKSCVVLVYMSLQNVDGATDVLLNFFDVLLSNVRQDHSEEIGGHIRAILEECIEESDQDVNPSVLCMLLKGLLPTTRNENPATYRLSQSVLRRVVNSIQPAVSSIINKILVGASVDMDDLEGYDFVDQVQNLIFELHKVSPGLLLHILPNICTHLQVEEVDIRHKAVKLLGNLFASPYADYGVEFSRNFRDFLGRFVDVSPVIREEMVQTGAQILLCKPDLRPTIEDSLIKRLRDSEWEIRQSTLLRLSDVAFDDPTALSREAYAELADRMKDRRTSVRRSAMLCLAKLYARHVSGRFTDLNVLFSVTDTFLLGDHAFGAPPEFWALLKPIPGYIISCWGYPEFTDKQLVIQLLQEYIIPCYVYNPCSSNAITASSSMKSSINLRSDVEATSSSPETSIEQFRAGRSNVTEGVRATALVALWSTLDSTGRSGFASILGFKTKVRKSLREFLRARSGSSNGMVLRKSMLHLLSVLPPQEKKYFTSDSLNSARDNHVYRLLSRALDSQHSVSAKSLPCSSNGFHSDCAYRDDLRSRVGSKTPLGEYLSCLYETASFMIGSQSMMQLIIGAGITTAQPQKHAESNDIGNLLLNLLSLFSKYCPESFEDSNEAISEWLQLIICGGGKHSRDKHAKSSKNVFLVDKNNALLLLSVVKLSANFLWPTKEGNREELKNSVQPNVAAIRDSNSLCDFLFRCAKMCSDPDVCYSLSQAACALINMNNDAVDSAILNEKSRRWQAYVPEMIEKIISSSNLRIPHTSSRVHNNSMTSLACDLFTAAPLCHIGMSCAVVAEAEISKFIDSEYLEWAMIGAHESSSLDFDELLILEGAIRVWVACAIVKESKDPRSPISNSTSSSDHAIAPTTARNIQAILSSLEVHGARFGNRKVYDDNLRDKLREICACALMDIIMVKSVGRSLSVSQWHTLAWTLIDSSGDCRRKALASLCQVIQKTNVHPRFLALPCLVANDDENRLLAQQAFEFSIKRLRLSHDVVCSKIMVLEDQENDQEAERMRHVAEGNMPECVLPFVIQLLSHHPDFPVSTSFLEDGDERRVGNIVNSLKMVINSLLRSGGSAMSNNLSYMIKQVEILGTYYCDRLSGDRGALSTVANLAREVLNERSRVVENFQPYPGEITLPMDLYRRIPSGIPPVKEVQNNVSPLHAVKASDTEPMFTTYVITASAQKGEKRKFSGELSFKPQQPSLLDAMVKPSGGVLNNDDVSDRDENSISKPRRSGASGKAPLKPTNVNLLVPSEKSCTAIISKKFSSSKHHASVLQTSAATRRSKRRKFSSENCENIDKYFSSG